MTGSIIEKDRLGWNSVHPLYENTDVTFGLQNRACWLSIYKRQLFEEKYKLGSFQCCGHSDKYQAVETGMASCLKKAFNNSLNKCMNMLVIKPIINMFISRFFRSLSYKFNMIKTSL